MHPTRHIGRHAHNTRPNVAIGSRPSLMTFESQRSRQGSSASLNIGSFQARISAYNSLVPDWAVKKQGVFVKQRMERLLFESTD